MLNKLSKFFSDSSHQKHAEMQDVQSTPHSDLRPDSGEIERSPPKAKTTGNVSLLKVCDQKLEKLSKFFALEENSVSSGEETPGETSDAAARTATEAGVTQTIEKASDVAENLSLLQLCDQKLERFSKFFALEDNAVSVSSDEKPSSGTPPAVLEVETIDTQSIVKVSGVAENTSVFQSYDQKLEALSKYFTGDDKSLALQSDAAVNAGLQVELKPKSEMPPVSNIDGSISSNAASDQMFDKSSAFLSDKIEAAPAIEEGSHAGNVALELPIVTEKMLETPSDFMAPIQDVHVDIAAVATEPARCRDSKIEEQLQLLEQLLEEHITKVKVAENDLSAFKDELRQQINTHAHANEQQLLDNKITLEITLKSAIRKIIDRQTALEENYNQQSGLILQALDTNQEYLSATAGKLDEIADHLRQLTENAQNLSNKMEKLQSDFEVNAAAAHANATKKAPKRKSWFK